MSTSEDIDERPAWKQGGEIQLGEFCIFGLMGAYPYGVGRRIKRGSILDGEDPTDIEFQWYGNPSYNMEQAIQPGWRNLKRCTTEAAVWESEPSGIDGKALDWESERAERATRSRRNYQNFNINQIIVRT